MKKNPVIIIGMHRSGTTMITRTLQELGLFVGEDVSLNWESSFFENINEWLFKQVNASWDAPSNAKFFNQHLKSVVKPIIEKQFISYNRKSYLGWKKFIKYSSVRNISIPWGWKDPKNSFTVSIWKELFPKAKILHIYRNPIDVAESLRVREEQITNSFKTSLFQKFKDFFGLRKKVSTNLSFRVQDVHEGVLLWEEYVTQCISALQKYEKDGLSVNYEKILDNPYKEIKKICKFIDLKVSDKDLRSAADKINSRRKYAFLKNKEMVKVYNSVKRRKVIKELNYERISK